MQYSYSRQTYRQACYTPVSRHDCAHLCLQASLARWVEASYTRVSRVRWVEASYTRVSRVRWVEASCKCLHPLPNCLHAPTHTQAQTETEQQRQGHRQSERDRDTGWYV